MKLTPNPFLALQSEEEFQVNMTGHSNPINVNEPDYGDLLTMPNFTAIKKSWFSSLLMPKTTFVFGECSDSHLKCSKLESRNLLSGVDHVKSCIVSTFALTPLNTKVIVNDFVPKHAANHRM